MRLRRLPLGAMVAMALAIPVSASQGVSAAGALPLVSPCHTVALAPSVGRGSAAAGTAYETLLIKNRSSHVNGHLKFPMGGQEKSPDTVIDLPGYGHQIPHVAMV